MENTQNMERKLRRALRKSGYALRKSRKRNCTEDNQGGYMIFDIYLNGVIDGRHYDLTLNDVADWVAYLC